MRISQKEIQVEDEGELVVEMEEVGKCSREPLKNERQDGTWSIPTHVEGKE